MSKTMPVDTTREDDGTIEAILIFKREVPNYLQAGEFYKSLSDDDQEAVSVPENTVVTDCADLKHF